MERQTFERALHAWDDWHSSIEQSRKLLGYDPKAGIIPYSAPVLGGLFLQ